MIQRRIGRWLSRRPNNGITLDDRAGFQIIILQTVDRTGTSWNARLSRAESSIQFIYQVSIWVNSQTNLTLPTIHHSHTAYHPRCLILKHKLSNDSRQIVARNTTTKCSWLPVAWLSQRIIPLVLRTDCVDSHRTLLSEHLIGRQKLRKLLLRCTILLLRHRNCLPRPFRPHICRHSIYAPC